MPSMLCSARSQRLERSSGLAMGVLASSEFCSEVSRVEDASLSKMVARARSFVPRHRVRQVVDAECVGAPWNDADLIERYQSGERRFAGMSLPGAQLCSANLSEANFGRAVLSGANLRRSNLRGCNLQGADLCGADLRGANLCMADLRGVDFSGADLRGANLSGAQLLSGSLSAAKIDGTTRFSRRRRRR